MKNYIIVLIFFILSACESAFTKIDIRDPDPKLLVYSFATSDSTPKLYLSDNKSVNYDNWYIPPIENGLVRLYKQNELLCTLEQDGQYYTNGSVRFEPDQNYRYTVQMDGYNTIEASIHIPEKPEVTSLDTSVFWDQSSANYKIKVNIDFIDNPENKDYYSVEVLHAVKVKLVDEFDKEKIIASELHKERLHITSLAPYIELVRAKSDYFYSDIQNNRSGDKFYFSDTYLQNGQKNTLIFNINTELFTEGWFDIEHFIVRFSAVDKHIYEYALSKSRNRKASKNPFVEPVTIYSNVTDGIGLVSASNYYAKSFDASLINQLVKKEDGGSGW
jgi:hypothetical protein